MRCSQLIKSKEIHLELSVKKQNSLAYMSEKHDANFIILQKLLSKTEASKIRKVTNDIKNKNSSFK